MEKSIIVKDISKRYMLYENMKDRLFDLMTPRKVGEPFWALKNVNFEANQGEVIGFVGINGSGKSTLSNIIAGIVPESSGTVQVNGQASLIAVAAGLKSNLTGLENIELKLLMLGFSKQEIQKLEKDIIEFSELGKFIHQPVKSYSSGMKSRLGFSISVNIDPDILIIDEALSVGDRAFAEKSLDKMNEFKEKGKTMIFVSHSLNQMKKFCDKILWLEFGRVKKYGLVEDVLPEYEYFLTAWKQFTQEEREEYRTKALNGSLDYESFVSQVTPEENITHKEKLVSKITRLKNNKAKIYLYSNEKMEESNEYVFANRTYFIKKAMIIGKEIYYLVSNEPSFCREVVGWVNKRELDFRELVHIDTDSKEFVITGNGKAFNRPWGSKDDIICNDLSIYKGKIFKVNRTDKVGPSVWFLGILEEKETWIRNVNLEEISN